MSNTPAQIVIFILIIATFNLTGSLTMLIIDKQQDIFILKSFGASTTMLKKVFILKFNLFYKFLKFV